MIFNNCWKSLQRLKMALIEPGWTVADKVRAVSTTRAGGVSRGPWASFNLSFNCGDNSEHVAENHRRLADRLPAAPRWLRQVHGAHLIHLDDWQPDVAADAAWTDRPGQVAAILTADCLPILLARASGKPGAPLVAAIHAGWRGLASSIVEHTVASLPAPATDLVAWIGPGISAACYEVGNEVRSAFVAMDPELEQAFPVNDRGRYQADLKAVARHQLQAAGVGRIHDAGLCTATDTDRFYSFRRASQSDAGLTGRQATLVWIDVN